MKRFLFLPVIIFLLASMVYGKDTLRVKNKDVVIQAVRINSHIEVDGKLDEDFWMSIEGFEYFFQRDPVEGAAASEKTVMKIAYDEEALYLGAKMYDSHPDSIMARLSRRDEWINSDHITLYLDSHNDKRSGYFFAVNAGGTLIDGVLYNDEWDDESWDGVWEGKVVIDSEGWTAEMRIPFSQMRFNKGENMVWGINFRRKIARRDEWNFLVFIPKNESGFVSHFASLTGFENISSSGQIEILPYVTTRAEYLQFEKGDPFNDGSDYIPSAGVDIKAGIGSNLTLNATVNPDFGQVEIDPAVINLSDVETFFEEKRPFFTEGSTIFNFGYGGVRNYWGFNWGSPDFFYSRRIGRQPQGGVPDADFVDYPSGTHILAAGKITGKIGNNWNIGTIHNITKREYARISKGGLQSDAEVEPMAYYGVLRAQKEFNEGHSGLGTISTITLRNFKDERLINEFNSSAFSFGLDGWAFLDDNKEWVFAGWTGASHLTGNVERITALQLDSRHYFQRPDAKHISLDSNRTSFTGYAGRFHLNKQKGNFFVNTALGFLTPEFNVNDLGFFFRADKINWHAGAGYYWSDPTDYYRYIEIGGAVFQNYDFGGTKTWEGIFHFGSMQFPNYYSAYWNLAYYTETFNNTRTRGGPLTLNPASYQVTLFLSSDSRKDWEVGAGGGTVQSDPSYEWFAEFEMEWSPLPNILFSFNPDFSRVFEYAQYVDTFNDPAAVNTYGKRYVFAELDQKTLSASIRLNWTFTPQLSLQLYVQPLISSGDYTNFKELASAGTYDFITYGEAGSTFDPETNTADPDGDGPAEQIRLTNPDFNFRSLRGNAVLRWEYLPGSVIYFVWTQTRSEAEEIGEFRLGNSFSRMMTTQPDNIFMVKFTYWFNI